MSAVATAIDAARAEGRGALIGYLPIGYPDLQTSIEAAVTLAEAGVDILELGPPYSDPVMDGPVIQEATNAALQAGFRMRDTFTAVREVSARTDVPVLVMTYWNPVVQYGVSRYADDLSAAGGAGLIVRSGGPDTPYQVISADDWAHGGTTGSGADLNGDGRVDGADLGLLLSQWGSSGSADLNGDGTVDGGDIGLMLVEWSEG